MAEILEKKRWTIDWLSKRKKVDYRLTHQHIYIERETHISYRNRIPTQRPEGLTINMGWTALRPHMSDMTSRWFTHHAACLTQLHGKQFVCLFLTSLGAEIWEENEGRRFQVLESSDSLKRHFSSRIPFPKLCSKAQQLAAELASHMTTAPEEPWEHPIGLWDSHVDLYVPLVNRPKQPPPISREMPLSHCVSCGIADYRCYTPTSFRKKKNLPQSKDRPNRGGGGVSQKSLPLKLALLGPSREIVSPIAL